MKLPRTVYRATRGRSSYATGQLVRTLRRKRLTPHSCLLSSMIVSVMTNTTTKHPYNELWYCDYYSNRAKQINRSTLANLLHHLRVLMRFFQRGKNLYKSCILLVKINSPPNLVRDKGIYSTRAGSILTSAGPAWDLRVQLMEHEGEDQWVQGVGTDGSKKWRIVYCLSRRSLMKRR